VRSLAFENFYRNRVLRWLSCETQARKTGPFLKSIRHHRDIGHINRLITSNSNGNLSDQTGVLQSAFKPDRIVFLLLFDGPYWQLRIIALNGTDHLSK